MNTLSSNNNFSREIKMDKENKQLKIEIEKLKQENENFKKEEERRRKYELEKAERKWQKYNEKYKKCKFFLNLNLNLLCYTKNSQIIVGR